MTRRKSRSSRKSPSILPAWIWLTLGILIGLGIALITRMDGTSTLRNDEIAATQQQVPAEPNTKRKFDFYTLLPELEIVIPQDETRPPKVNVPNKTSDYKGGYLLQAGSFNKYNEADTLKARLALIGVEAYIQTVEVNKTKWHRVQIGPSTDRQKLEVLRKRLKENQIDTILLQAKS